MMSHLFTTLAAIFALVFILGDCDIGRSCQLPQKKLDLPTE